MSYLSEVLRFLFDQQILYPISLEWLKYYGSDGLYQTSRHQRKISLPKDASFVFLNNSILNGSSISKITQMREVIIKCAFKK